MSRSRLGSGISCIALLAAALLVHLGTGCAPAAEGVNQAPGALGGGSTGGAASGGQAATGGLASTGGSGTGAGFAAGGLGPSLTGGAGVGGALLGSGGAGASDGGAPASGGQSASVGGGAALSDELLFAIYEMCAMNCAGKSDLEGCPPVSDSCLGDCVGPLDSVALAGCPVMPLTDCLRAHPEGLVYSCVDGVPTATSSPCQAESKAMKDCAAAL